MAPSGRAGNAGQTTSALITRSRPRLEHSTNVRPQRPKSSFHVDAMQSPIPYEQRRHVEAAVLALVLAEDWPWRTNELAERLDVSVDVIGLATATLIADGLLITDDRKLRASWTAVRGDELANWRDSNERRVYVPGFGGAIPLT
jgi:hypothetical protein